MEFDIWVLMSLAFGLGVMHALDADHVIAVCGLSSQRADKSSSFFYCTRWALGHSGALLIIGSAVLFMGLAIPEKLSFYAEHVVGLVLILMGLYLIWDVCRKKAHLHFHRHDGLLQHAHWHTHHGASKNHKKDKHEHNHAPVFIGVLHGLAGSAPLLALLPLSRVSSPWLGITYLLLFSLGVLIAMLIFGGLLGQVFSNVKHWGNRFMTAIRVTVSLLSIAYGIKIVLVSF